MRVFRKFRSSDGRVKVTTAVGVLAVAAALALSLTLPVSAAHVDPEVLPNNPDCTVLDAGDYLFEHKTAKPTTDKITLEYNGLSGSIEVTVYTEGGNEKFDFSYTGDFVAAAVIVKGGPDANFYDYRPGEAEDTGLQAPIRVGNRTYDLSHISFCNVEKPLGSVSGVKYHDRDTDGALDDTEESGLSGWTITAFDSNGAPAESALTDSDGAYTIGGLASGTYTICEATSSDGLPDDGSGFEWRWTQSEPADNSFGDCSFEGYEPFGYTVTVDGDTHTGFDFGNHRQVSVTCDPVNDVVVTLPGDNDEPTSSVTFPAGCQSGVDNNPPYTTSFDLGLSDDGDAWDQFVVFSGDINESSIVLEQTIVWAPETANYVDGSLVVPTTQVLLDLGGTIPDDLEDVTFCHEFTDEEPTTDVPQCLDSRLIAEGGDVPEGNIQITENYKLLGDPINFR